MIKDKNKKAIYQHVVIKNEAEIDILKKYEIIPKFKVINEIISFSGLYEECLQWIKDEQKLDLSKEIKMQKIIENNLEYKREQIISSINNSNNKTTWSYYNLRQQDFTQREWNGSLLNEITKITSKNNYDCIISSLESMSIISCSPLYESMDRELLILKGSSSSGLLKFGVINKEIGVYLDSALPPMVILFNESDFKDSDDAFECSIILIKDIYDIEGGLGLKEDKCETNLFSAETNLFSAETILIDENIVGLVEGLIKCEFNLGKDFNEKRHPSTIQFQYISDSDIFYDNDLIIKKGESIPYFSTIGNKFKDKKASVVLDFRGEGIVRYETFDYKKLKTIGDDFKVNVTANYRYKI